MNITGILVAAQPGRIEQLRERLAAMPGVEVHAATPEGQQVAGARRYACTLCHAPQFDARPLLESTFKGRPGKQ